MGEAGTKIKAVVFTLGCKVNDVESGSIIRGLEEAGFCVFRELVKADLYIFNTCAVTAEAERKSRQAIGKAIKLNEKAKIVVCGCAAEKSPSDFFEKSNQVVFVSGAKGKNKVLEVAKTVLDRCDRRIEVSPWGKEYEEMLVPECLKTRNFVKIQDGCNRFCSYCVIPYLRGRSRSRDMDSAAAEILASTAKETVVTGIDVSSYQDEKGRDLADLLHAVKDADTRIRLGSLEVSVVTERLLEAAKGLKNFAPQFHLSLQSGSNKVLKSMNRHYTREEYLKKCKMIYEAFENASITTDIIVGFPMEEEEDFLDSLNMVEEAGFSQIHAFPYSPREGTNAYKKYKEIPAAIKKERLARILEAGRRQKEKYLDACIGKVLEIVPESFLDGYTEGYAENYVRTYVFGDIGKEPRKIAIKEKYKDGVLGELVDGIKG